MTFLGKKHQKHEKFYIVLKGNYSLMKEEEVSKKFSGEWLLLFNDEIIDHSVNVEDILKLAEEKFPQEKFPDDEIKISKVISEKTNFR